MKSKQCIEVWVSPEGAITVAAHGYTGNSCEEATRFLEEELGSIGRRQRTRDWYRNHRNTHRTSNDTQQEQQT
ncbi:MAG: DUF2997 domain-containing protein [Verrucomicrobiae bacterium]|nr:DUF2997 domain-containing protein [Verrucomicrobiae bacterium]